MERKKTLIILILRAVFIYGFATEMDKIKEIAKKHNLCIIKDVAEAIGIEYIGNY